jgi:hypothetical protein
MADAGVTCEGIVQQAAAQIAEFADRVANRELLRGPQCPRSHSRDTTCLQRSKEKIQGFFQARSSL